jgi:hypothetical protein
VRVQGRVMYVVISRGSALSECTDVNEARYEQELTPLEQG